MHRFRIRRRVAGASCATVPVALFLLVTALTVLLAGPITLGIALGLAFALTVFAVSYRRVRRRTMTVTPQGIEVQRDKYRLAFTWDQISKVQNRRHQKFMDVEELVVHGATIEALDHRGRATTVPRELAGHPAATRVMVSLYDKDWRNGPIGEHLGREGLTDEFEAPNRSERAHPDQGA